MMHVHHDAEIAIAAMPNGTASVYLEQPSVHPDERNDEVFLYFTAREWRALSRHVEEALREAALLRRRAKSAERRKRDAMKGTR